MVESYRPRVEAVSDEELKLSHRIRLFARQAVIASDYRRVPGFVERDSVKYDLSQGVEVGGESGADVLAGLVGDEGGEMVDGDDVDRVRADVHGEDGVEEGGPL